MTMIDTDGAMIGVVDEGEGPAVVLLHGFPELAYSWRHVVPALVAAGYRVIVPDQRGYGVSSKPDDVGSYRLDRLSSDVVRILDALDVERAAVVGHDWGSIVAFATAILHPDRVERVASLNVPYRGAFWGFPTTDFIRENLAERFSYVLMFQEPGVAEAGFAADPASWLQVFYLGGCRGRSFLDEGELSVYVDAFEAGGITGPVNWYRNIDANAEMYGHLLDARIDQPFLMIAADDDPVLPLRLTEGLERWIPDLTRVVVDDCRHWTQQEQPEAVNVALLDWLGS